MNSMLPRSIGCLFLFPWIASLAAAEPGDTLPDWFEENRVQAHFENGIQHDLAGLFEELHPAIRRMGSHVLTRIFKTTAEGAWWPTEAGYTHEALDGRDLGREIAENAHQHGLQVFAYYRIMCDDFVEKEHPEWLCRDGSGQLVLEPRTRRRPREEDRKHVICFNSPARELIRTRLVELADRGVDGIYFDSWHMPEICTCESCRAAFEKETGRPMPANAQRGSEEYQRICQFVARSIVRNFRDWKRTVKQEHPNIVFAIGSSLYPCFDRQMQITAPLLAISDTSKTEFSKPFGGFLGWPPNEPANEVMRRRRPYLEPSFAIPAYDVQNALGWSLTRDSCDGRPPLMWIPFTRTEEEALFSTAAAVTYGCIASIHPTGLWTRRTGAIQEAATQKYTSSYSLGRNASPWLAGSRPHRFALIHVSQRSRDARIADPRALWVKFFAPILGAFEALKEEHLPVATINDLQIQRGIPSQTRVVIVPHERELGDSQRSVLRAFEAAGGTILRLDADSGWHLKREKARLQRAIIGQITAASDPPPIRARGPAAMHAVFYHKPDSRRLIACLANDFGWYRCERQVRETSSDRKAPPPCTNVTLEVRDAQRSVRRAFEAVTGTELPFRREDETTVIRVPEFPVMACVVIE
jgi:hypothetical protein